MRFIATCKIGLESVVSLELRRLGIEVEKVEDARVLFLGDYQDDGKGLLVAAYGGTGAHGGGKL